MNVNPTRNGPKLRITRTILKPKIFGDPTILAGLPSDSVIDQKNYVFTCQYCRVKFKQNSHFYRHMISYHQVQQKEAVFVCNDCQMIFIKKASLDRHCQAKHQLKSKSRCEVCSITFKSRYCLRRHLKLKQVLLENACLKCNKKFTTKERLLKHTGNKHSYKNVMYQCERCGLKFKAHSSLLVHLNRMHKKL